MLDKCSSCETTESLVFWSVSPAGSSYVLCRKCRNAPMPSLADVAYPYGSGTHTEENIAYPNGHPQAGQPIPFSSRRGKLEAMRIAGVREAGDRNHGAINCRTDKKKIFFT